MVSGRKTLTLLEITNEPCTSVSIELSFESKFPTPPKIYCLVLRYSGVGIAMQSLFS